MESIKRKPGMMQRVFTGWHVIRRVRLLLGTAATAQGILQKEGWLVVAGILILIGAVFNAGCCSSAGCAVPPFRNTLKKETEHEELDSAT